MSKDYINKYAVPIIKSLYEDGGLPENLESDILGWLVNGEYPQQKEEALMDVWNSIAENSAGHTGSASDLESSLKKVNERIGYGTPAKKISLQKMTLRIAAVVLPLFIIAGGLMLYFNNRVTVTPDTVAVIEGPEITMPETIIVEAVSGMRYGLPDGSTVTLNAGSKVEFTEDFADGRLIALEGEGLFEVVSDIDNPFTVKTPTIDINVLGTTFNVKAYLDEPNTLVTLIKGSVEVVTPDQNKVILKPNQQFVLDNESGQARVDKVIAEAVAQWTAAPTGGNLTFENATLLEILNAVERSRGIQFTGDKSRLGKERYTVRFLEEETPEQLLEILSELSGTFTYASNGNIINIETLQ